VTLPISLPVPMDTCLPSMEVPGGGTVGGLGGRAVSVPKGYKRTEVGIIPDEWGVQSLGNAAGITTGRKDVNEGCPTGAYPFFTCSRDHTYSNSYSFDSESILVAGNGDVGNLHYYHGRFEAYQRTYVLRDFKLPAKYIWHQLDHRLAASLGLGKIGTSIPYIKKGNLTGFAFPTPATEAEQRAIAEALGDVDALLGALDAAIAKQRDLKQATMQQLLTSQTRLPGFEGEWETKRLREITRIPVTDGPHLTPDFLADGIPFLSVNNLTHNRVDLSDLRYISREDHLVFSMKCKPQKGDILLGKAASVGKVALVEIDFEFNIWSPIALIRINDFSDPLFVYYQLQGKDLIDQITLLTNSSSQGNIGMGDIERLKFKIPPLSEQLAIAAFLSDMDAALTALESRRAKTAALKQAMMQSLLTGRIRLV